MEGVEAVDAEVGAKTDIPHLYKNIFIRTHVQAEISRKFKNIRRVYPG